MVCFLFFFHSPFQGLFIFGELLILKGLTRYIYYPSAGSWKGYFGSAFLLDANETIIAYVPWYEKNSNLIEEME